MIPRRLNILNLLMKKKSVLLLGPRGTGKTALLKSILDQSDSKVSYDLLQGDQYLRYVNKPSQLRLELEDYISKNKNLTIVAIDEIQKIPALLDEVHSLIENYKKQLVFILSGSSARKLKRGDANLLAGRAITKELYPLSQLETDLKTISVTKYGALPEVYLSEQSLKIPFLDSYVLTYLREEIQQEALTRGIERFSRFLEMAAQLNSEPINYAKLGKQIGIAGKTVAEYFNILIDTLIVRQIPGWSHSVKKQLLQSPKYYFFDCGVLNAINGYLRAEISQNSFLFGKLFETFAVNQIFAANEYLELGLRFYYWREKNGNEVDLIIARNLLEPIAAVEIKSGIRPNAEDCSGFKFFSQDYPKVPKYCICQTAHAYSENHIKFIPWQEFILNLGRYV